MYCMDRRKFLKTSLAVGATLPLVSGYRMPVQASENRKAILMESEKCISCRRCVAACNGYNEVDPEKPYLSIESPEEDSELIKRVSCMHCDDAACVKVCPSGTLYKGENGFTFINKENCIGCGYCVQVCPYSVVTLRDGKVNKCIGCRELVNNGDIPKCVGECPVEALHYDNWQVLADKYASNNLYGTEQFDGLGVLMLLGGNPEAYGYPNDESNGILLDGWKNLLHPGGLFLTAAATSIGLITFGIAKKNYKNGSEEGGGVDE